jgi:menaquinone-dependent protoporphyrinogen oxidase
VKQPPERKGISRRKFLALAGGAIVTSIAVCGGGAALVAAPIPALDFGDNTYGEGVTAMKVLVTYASRYGSTADVARAIGKRLGERGMSVDVRPVEEVAPQSIAAYDAVAIGGAVRVGSWLPAAVKFVEQNQAALSQKQVAYFAVHFLNTEDTAESREKRAAYLVGPRSKVAPVSEAYFAGKIDPSGMSLGDKLATKVVKAPTGDRRDWQAIDAWAGGLFTA